MNIEELKKAIKKIEEEIKDKLKEKVFNEEIQKIYFEVASFRKTVTSVVTDNERLQRRIEEKLELYSK